MTFRYTLCSNIASVYDNGQDMYWNDRGKLNSHNRTFAMFVCHVITLISTQCTKQRQS